VGGLIAAALYSSGDRLETRAGALAVVDLNRNRIVRFETLTFDDLDGEQIPVTLGTLLQALDLGYVGPLPAYSSY
jgi:hypothetical protein